MAGKGWYYTFMNRHPELSLRLPEKISMARATGFNQKNVHEFFDILVKCVDENRFYAQTIHTVNESGFSTVQKRNKKNSRKGKHQVGGIASSETGVNTTVVVCASAAGQTAPPMIIFKRKRMAPELTIGAYLALLLQFQLLDISIPNFLLNGYSTSLST
ncbi:unnamed protein product [Acanthoscelides obtectus]|uniref:HTH CENPB-type domain-containing protein n=1 Tax=Acanthoscelides obtectus TaxID=200917 RepID=A0A9P0Q036_ACAOB|nr:unnamed protein product [Acanthoscelides obtectus]CAK1633357.1 hypothetical protein AOBTE_LOCUS8070 [Acanthoscelides obtectus]